MSRYLATTAALSLIAVCGVVHGMRSDRWQTSQALEDAMARVARVPAEVGDWKSESIEGDALAFKQAGAQAYWTRLYTNARKRQTVLAILMCGRAGRMSVHTPEVCYRGAGYELYDKPAPTPLRGESAEELGVFNTARFVKGTGAGGTLRLYWSWNGGAGWQAPSSPRWEFRGRPFLYKLYVSQELTSINEPDAAADLLRELLPELKKVLYAGEP